jgi:hypothetical protein
MALNQPTNSGFFKLGKGIELNFGIFEEIDICYFKVMMKVALENN